MVLNFFSLHPFLYLLVSWAWWDWPLTWLTSHRPSVLWHCWLGHLTRKIVSEMTYNVSSGTLNTTIPIETRIATGCIMFSGRPSVYPSVHMFPHLWTWCFVNEWTSFDANWHNWSVVQWHETIKSQDHTDRFVCVAEASFWTPLCRVAFIV